MKTTQSKTFLDLWHTFSSETNLGYKEVPEWFLKEMKRAFYWGAFSFVAEMMPLSPDDDTERMEKAMDEIAAFINGDKNKR